MREDLPEPACQGDPGKGLLRSVAWPTPQPEYAWVLLTELLTVPVGPDPFHVQASPTLKAASIQGRPDTVGQAACRSKRNGRSVSSSVGCQGPPRS